MEQGADQSAPTRVPGLEITRRTNAVGRSAHDHRAYELIWVQNGRMRIAFADRVYDVAPDSLVAVSHLERHTVIVLEAPYERYFALLPPRQTDAWVGSRVLLSLFKNRPKAFSHVLDCSRVSGQLLPLFEGLRQEQAMHSAPFFDQRMGALLRLLLTTLYRDQPASFPVAAEAGRDPIFEAQMVMDRQFDQNLRVKELAERAFMSESGFTRRFHSQTGLSPKQYLMLTRLAHAEHLLRYSHLSIGEICTQCGFGDVNNFIKRFRKEYGLTPSALREQGAASR